MKSRKNKKASKLAISLNNKQIPQLPRPPHNNKLSPTKVRSFNRLFLRNQSWLSTENRGNKKGLEENIQITHNLLKTNKNAYKHLSRRNVLLNPCLKANRTQVPSAGDRQLPGNGLIFLPWCYLGSRLRGNCITNIIYTSGTFAHRTRLIHRCVMHRLACVKIFIRKSK